MHHLLQAHYTNESMKYRKLLIDKATLETEKEELTAERDQFKNTLRLITQFSDFPVNKYCTLTNEGGLIIIYYQEFIITGCLAQWLQYWVCSAPHRDGGKLDNQTFI